MTRLQKVKALEIIGLTPDDKVMMSFTQKIRIADNRRKYEESNGFATTYGCDLMKYRMSLMNKINNKEIKAIVNEDVANQTIVDHFGLSKSAVSQARKSDTYGNCFYTNKYKLDKILELTL